MILFISKKFTKCRTNSVKAASLLLAFMMQVYFKVKNWKHKKIDYMILKSISNFIKTSFILLIFMN